MKIFSQHCELLEYAITTPSDVAIPLDPDAVGCWHTVENCLFLLVSVERDDFPQLAKAVKAIRRIGRITTAKQIVLNGFSGFIAADQSPDPESAQAILADTVRRLELHGWETRVMPFGWNKRWRISVYDGIWAQRVTHI